MTGSSSSGGDARVETNQAQMPGVILFLLLSSTLCLIFSDTTWMWIIVATLGFLLGMAAYVCSRRRVAAASSSASSGAGSSITCSQALLSDCFSWQRSTHPFSSASSSSSSFRIGQGSGMRRFSGHRLAVEEGVALSSRGGGGVDRFQLLLVDGDFSSEHFELLSQLDEDLGDTPNSLGATQAELDRLPTYLVGAGKQGGENNNCFICLTGFEQGDVVRILPCFHQFHQESCCDPWLKTKMQCPVCRVLL